MVPYRPGTGHPHALPGGINIRIVPVKYLLATKLAAYFNRGTDTLASKDAEDIAILVNGRDALVDEVLAGPDDLREYVHSELGKFIADSNFDYLLDSALNGEEPERVEMVMERFSRLAGKE